MPDAYDNGGALFYEGARSFLQLWLAGVPHAGGLRDLALAEMAASSRLRSGAE